MLHRDRHLRLCRARTALREVGQFHRSIDDVARAAGVSRFHFVRLFKGLFGETPYHCRSTAQLARAKALLLLSDLSVTAICLEVGFTSLGSFSALFTRRVGESPSSFQRRFRAAAQAERGMPRGLGPGCFGLMGGDSTEDRKNREAAPAGV